MDRTSRTIANLRQYVEENPNDMDQVNEFVAEIADKLESGEYKLIEMSGIFKKWKRPHGHLVYQIFANSYRDAAQ